VSEKRPPRGLLDTSIFVALEKVAPAARGTSATERDLGRDPAELRVGVLAAADIASRDRRIATLEGSGRFTVPPIDER